jgi:hypothetical protein
MYEYLSYNSPTKNYSLSSYDGASYDGTTCDGYCLIGDIEAELKNPEDKNA